MSTRCVRLRAIAIAALCVAAVACPARKQPPPPKPAPAPVVLAPGDASVRYVGWVDRRDAREVKLAWPGSQVELSFFGTGARARLRDTPVEDETRETDWIAVIVDGREPRALPLKEGEHEYAIAQGLPRGLHRVVLWKRTEAEVGTIGVLGFPLDDKTQGALLPAPRARRLVVIGDSISAGYGNEGPDSSCHWSAARENSYETYGAVAARLLDAQVSIAAWSGKGVARNYEPRDALTLPQLWDRVLPMDEASPRIAHDSADAVIVNLGTNDFFQGMPDERAFLTAYRAFLGAVRARYPKALLVLALGPMLADDYPQKNARTRARRWLKRLQAEQRKAGAQVAFIELWTDPADGAGCDSHPNRKTHARMGQELAAALREALRW